MAKQLTKKELVAAYKELDKVAGVDPAIEYDDMEVEEFEKELYDTITYVDEETKEPFLTEDDKFTDKTTAVFEALKEKYGEEPEPEEEPEEASMEDEINDLDDVDDLKEYVKDHKKEFKGFDPKAFKKAKDLKKAMLEHIAPEEPEEEPEEVPEEPEENELITSINELDALDDLRDLVKENKKEFKGFDAKPFKKVKDLRKAMIEHLTPAPEEAPEEEEKPKGKTKPAPKKEEAKEEKTKKKSGGSSTPGKKAGAVGIVQTIAILLTEAGRKGITKEDILDELVERFPDKAKDSMKSTVSLHVPGLMTKERFPVAKIEGTNLYYRSGSHKDPLKKDVPPMKEESTKPAATKPVAKKK